MSSLISRLQSTEVTSSSEPRVIALRSEEVDPLFESLSSETRRTILRALYERPSTPSELASATDTSLQNVHYHLQKLEEVDLIESVDTRYSEKGKEMTVFAPANDPLIFVESEETRSRVESSLDRIIGVLSVLAIGSLLAQWLSGVFQPSTVTTDAGSAETFSAEAINTTAKASAVERGPDILAQLHGMLLEPGTLVFLGGLLAITVVLVMRWGRH